MRTFREFVDSKISRDDIRAMVLDAIGADEDSPTVDNSPLVNYEDREHILQMPELKSIIDQSDNRALILKLVQDPDTNVTVGTVIDAIRQ